MIVVVENFIQLGLPGIADSDVVAILRPRPPSKSMRKRHKNRIKKKSLSSDMIRIGRDNPASRLYLYKKDQPFLPFSGYILSVEEWAEIKDAGMPDWDLWDGKYPYALGGFGSDKSNLKWAEAREFVTNMVSGFVYFGETKIFFQKQADCAMARLALKGK